MPHEWYPVARKITREIYYHYGPTNSGKTRAALEALKEAKTGLYLAPLRLLAWEISETLNQNNVKCSLVTG
jgi:ATP-dependent RNA helicase SUPV3L1/SUV3